MRLKRRPVVKGAASTGLAAVTGATSGIGEAFARALAARGHDLLLTGRRREVLEASAAALQARYGVRVEVLIADLADPPQLRELETRIGAADDLALLVNNAGFGNRIDFLEDAVENQLAMLRVHAEATVRLCRASAATLARRGGAIINVASLAAFHSSPTCAMYCATKAFLVSFSESLAMSLAPRVRVMALCPGFTWTGFHERLCIGRERQRSHGIVRWMSADRVVALALGALTLGRVVYVPGVLNRLGLALTRLVPRRLYYRLARLSKLANAAKPAAPEKPATRKRP